LEDDTVPKSGVLHSLWRLASGLPRHHIDDKSDEGAEQEERHVGDLVLPCVRELEVDPYRGEYAGNAYDPRYGDE
jgi:hypothetical protein